MASRPYRRRSPLVALAPLGAALVGTLGVVVSAVAGGALTGAELLPDLRQEPPSQVAVRRDAGRPVLVFRSAAANVGQGPLVVNGRRERGQRTMHATQELRRADGSVVQVPIRARLKYQPGWHSHWHLLGFNRFELRDPATGARAAASRKVGFCLGGRYQVAPEVPGTPASPAINHNCGRYRPGLMRMRMGIDVGYADDYAAFVEFQYIDLTAVRPGRYLLAHESDPNGHLMVGDRSDDTAYALIDLTAPRRAGGLPGVSVVATSVGIPPVAPPS
ncbi:MAG: lysyl oxidase family protein [Miltoncostaeaceae bacterium]